jgi:hypothetical protein
VVLLHLRNLELILLGQPGRRELRSKEALSKVVAREKAVSIRWRVESW